MITIRQIERAWTARTYEKLFRELVSNRPEASFRFEHEQGRAIPAAAMAVIRLEELSQSHTPLAAKLVRAVQARSICRIVIMETASVRLPLLG